MGRATRHADRILLLIVAALVGGGLFIFASASLGLLARDSVSVTSIVTNHVLFGIGLGTVALLITSRIHYRHWKRFAIPLFAAALAATFLVFIPGLGLESGGATRWLQLGPFSLQPGEALKIGTIFMLAYTLTHYRARIQTVRYGLLPFLGILALPGIALLLQPDTGTFGVVVIAGLIMYWAAGARFRDVFAVGCIGLVLLGALIMVRPYVLDRVTTFVQPFSDPLNSGYQIKQSLIAIGSGGVTGRGFGQSIQKFSYLPEPVTDSIFAVAAEEFGLMGAVTIIGLFAAFGVRGMRIATRAPDYFGALLGIGIVSYIVGQAFINIGAMVGILPLTGIPLVFVSQGGTAMLIALGSVGILLNISRYARLN